MNILFAVSEATPFAKTGGLADVAGALPAALAEQGDKVYLFLPFYREIRMKYPEFEKRAEFSIPIGDQLMTGTIVSLKSEPKTHHPNLNILFIAQDELFDRPTLYGPEGKEYKDNGLRFTFFCRAVLEAVNILELDIDIFHAHDWQTGLIPVYLKTLYKNLPGYQGGSLFTIHNLGYQGIQDKALMPLTGIGWEEFNFKRLEFFDHLNLLKGGLVYADKLNTVSQAYCREILTPEFGFGLETVLKERQNDLHGILNGVDYDEWNPAQDSLIDNHFQIGQMSGKKACKKKLSQAFNLAYTENQPLVGMVSRLVDQKGFDLILPLLKKVDTFNAKFVFLGTGEKDIEEQLAKLSQKYPGRIAFTCGYDNRLAHLLEAGADIFLMPSRYEPCGLNQMYSLRYGTVPLVRATGGLDDSIANFNPRTCIGNGFKFHNYTITELKKTLNQALNIYHQPRLWHRLRANGMRCDFSWSQSAVKYRNLYKNILDG
ncbi:MAG: glycogen synthase GlgA [Deltaproteobacteria bacterium]|nr:glycogen synthase GlgA [Deltaproteobacteria bacterium]